MGKIVKSIGKAIKKVGKGLKKIIKKIGPVLLIAAAVYAGVAFYGASPVRDPPPAPAVPAPPGDIKPITF